MKKLNCILLIDDDPITNYVNKRLLESMAAADKILVTSNGKAAIQLLKQQIHSGQFPELIFLDVNMPVMSGVEFIENYKQLEFSSKELTKVVILTTSSHPSDLESFKDLPASVYLNKPLTKEKIVSIFTRFFDPGVPTNTGS